MSEAPEQKREKRPSRSKAIRIFCIKNLRNCGKLLLFFYMRSLTLKHWVLGLDPRAICPCHSSRRLCEKGALNNVTSIFLVTSQICYFVTDL